MASYRNRLPVVLADPEKQAQRETKREDVAKWFAGAIQACHDAMLPLPTQAHAWNAVRHGVDIAEYVDSLRADAVKRSVQGGPARRWKGTGKRRWTKRSGGKRRKGGGKRKSRRTFRRR